MAEQVRIDVTVEQPGDRGGALEFGLQDSNGDLVSGEAQADGAVRFAAEARLRRQPDGTVRYSGPHVHGPSKERFLYLSFRLPGAEEWARRLKIPLPERVGEGVGALRGRWRDRGTPRAEPVGGGWQTET